MGLLSAYKKFRQNQRDRQIAKALKLVQNPKAIREERDEAIGYFLTLDDPNVVIPSLLSRFEYSLEHGIADTREKEKSMKGILEFKEKALPFVIEHLKKTAHIAWPIKILEKITSENSFVEHLESLLVLKDFAFDQDQVEKNYDILCHLREFKVNKPERIKELLSAHDERIRFAAAEVILAQTHTDHYKVLVPYLTDVSAENLRLRQAVTQAFQKNKWVVN